jgi:hypothetical protein
VQTNLPSGVNLKATTYEYLHSLDGLQKSLEKKVELDEEAAKKKMEMIHGPSNANTANEKDDQPVRLTYAEDVRRRADLFIQEALKSAQKK